MPERPPEKGTEFLRMLSQRAATTVNKPPEIDAGAALDIRTETWLQAHGVRYASRAQIPLSMIDEKKSRDNQARDVALVPESVDRFSLALRQGAYLGAIVVFPSGSKFVIVDGNNREASHRRVGEQFIWAFVIDPATPSETIQLLTVSANNDHGVTPPLRWRILQAIFLTTNGHALEVASGATGVTVNQIRDHQHTMRADARAGELKISGFDKLPAGTRREVGRVVGDPVFYQVARAVIDTGMTLDDTKAFVKTLRQLRSEADQIGYVADVLKARKLEEQTRKATGRMPSQVSSPKNALVSSIGKIMKIDVGELVRSILTDLDREELLRRIDQADDRLIEMSLQLKRLREGDSG